jgi:hypothetical protein
VCLNGVRTLYCSVLFFYFGVADAVMELVRGLLGIAVSDIP